jgi:maltose/maltodextrin transport system substrate-binding protein/arabinogalactan oligomer/maltooligosaccharide transport system substrate-binding protein
MKRSSILLVSLLLVAGMLLAACAPAATPAPTTAAPTQAPTVAATTEVPTTAPTVETPAAAGSLTIWADETRAPIIVEIAKDFTAKYGVQVTVQQMGFGDIRDQLKVAGPAGEGPDILIGAHDWLGELVTNGLLAEIDLGDKAGDFFKPAVDAFTYNGKLYGVPYATENLAFFRNKDLVPDAPATWDDVTKISAELEKAGKVKYGYGLQESDPYHFYPIMTAFGGYVFGRDAQGNYDPTNVGLDSEGTIAAATWVQNMVKNKHLAAGLDYGTMHTMFEKGETAMMITGPWALDEIRKSGVNYAISNIPTGTQPGAPFLGVQGFMISSFSKDPLLAQTFLMEYVATMDTMQKIYDANPRPSAYLPLREKTTEPDMVAFGKAGENAQPMPAIPAMSSVWTAWGDAEKLLFQLKVTPAEGFKTAADQVRALLSK